MNIALCFENVNPARGGCETYIADLARRLIRDRHEVHLYASRWDPLALPDGLIVHALPRPRGARFLRPWRFARNCLRALEDNTHDLSIGFDKTWGQDILYPQGGLHLACANNNLNKYANPVKRGLARALKFIDPAFWSFALLERKQYLGNSNPLIIANSNMVKDHFAYYYGIPPERLRIVRNAIDPGRFREHDRPQLRDHWRRAWGLQAHENIALFAAMNYRLKGLDPLLHAVGCLVRRPEFLRRRPPFRLLVAGNPDSQRYQTLAQRLGIGEYVKFIGFCREMRNAYFAADFLVHPTFYDPCSLVVLEALACGLPVITTSANGASELLQPLQHGYVIDDPHDHNSLAWAMEQMLDPARLTSASRSARAAAADWTFEHHYQQIVRIFSEALILRKAA